jgi:hypothetical protein
MTEQRNNSRNSIELSNIEQRDGSGKGIFVMLRLGPLDRIAIENIASHTCSRDA